MINFKSDEPDNLAIIVENDLIQASLTQTLKNYDNLNVFYSTEVKDINKDDQDFVQLKLSDGSIINTKLLIGKEKNSFN